MNTKPETEKQSCDIMGYKRGTFPCNYLGIEIEKGSKTNKEWHNILDRMDKRIGGWKDKWITIAGKFTKIKVVLFALPTYPLSYLSLLKNINKKLEAKLRSFLWNDTNERKKLPLIKWENLCKT